MQVLKYILLSLGLTSALDTTFAMHDAMCTGVESDDR